MTEVNAGGRKNVITTDPFLNGRYAIQFERDGGTLINNGTMELTFTSGFCGWHIHGKPKSVTDELDPEDFYKSEIRESANVSNVRPMIPPNEMPPWKKKNWTNYTINPIIRQEKFDMHVTSFGTPRLCFCGLLFRNGLTFVQKSTKGQNC
jgi:hypothetical protein